jgi:hypothetical protein
VKTFVLWIIFIGTRYEPLDTFQSLDACKKAGAEFARRIEGTETEKLTRNVVCLPEGTYPKAPEVRR